LYKSYHYTTLSHNDEKLLIISKGDYLMEDLILDMKQHVAVLTMNRPLSMNAIGMNMAREFHEALDIIEDNRNIRAIVFTGSGNKSFCAGADLKERKEMTATEIWSHTSLIKEAFTRIDNNTLPTVAAIQGFALGGGTELAVSCDLRVMAEDAELGLTEVRLGVFPGAGGPVRLPRLISVSDAKDLLFTGRRITGKEAKEMRLVQRLVTNREDVLEEAIRLAEQIGMNGPLGVQAVKKVVNRGMEVSKEQASAYSDALRKPLDLTRDYAEALQAFSEKRTPNFSGE
jgi:enoyl-CoA hydratase/carnithine racemase